MPGSAGSGTTPVALEPRRWAMPLLGLAALVLAALLYRAEPAAYLQLLTILMLQPTDPPFIDAQQIPALIDCWQHGVDVYVSAPCDPGHRPLAYSPLWLRASFLPLDKAWSNALGLGMGGAFFLSLALLPPPPTGPLPFARLTRLAPPNRAVKRDLRMLMNNVLIICILFFN